MMISGNQTRCIFDRNNIIDDKDLRQAAQQVGTYNRELVRILVSQKVVLMPYKNKKWV